MLALATNSPACCVALLVRDVEAGEEAEEAMEVSISEDPAGAEAQETAQAVGVSLAAVRKHFLLEVPPWHCYVLNFARRKKWCNHLRPMTSASQRKGDCQWPWTQDLGMQRVKTVLPTVAGSLKWGWHNFSGRRCCRWGFKCSGRQRWRSLCQRWTRAVEMQRNDPVVRMRHCCNFDFVWLLQQIALHVVLRC